MTQSAPTLDRLVHITLGGDLAVATGDGSAPTPPPPPPPPADPYFSNVVLLLHFDGANGSQATTDSSSLANSMAFTSSAQLSTAQARFGTASLFNPNAPYGGVVHLAGQVVPAAMQLSNLNWTVEYWVYFTSYQDQGFLLNTSSGNGFSALAFGPRGGNNALNATVYDIYNQPYTQFAASAVSLNAWHFIQCRRRTDAGGSDYLELAIDGVQVPGGGTYLSPAGIKTLLPVTDWVIGGLSYQSGVNCEAFVDEVRVTIGVARDFNLPTAPFLDS